MTQADRPRKKASREGSPTKAPAIDLDRRVPPNSPEAEIALLGGILLRNEALDQVRDLLEAEDFYAPAHQKIYLAVIALYDRGENIDPITLRNALKDRGWLEDVGGPPTLEKLLDEVHTTANIEQYARIVAEKALLRRMLNSTLEIQGMIYESRDDRGEALNTEQIVDRSQQKIFDVARDTVKSPFESLEDIIHDSLKFVDQRMTSQGSLAGYSTGFADLDDATNGFKPGELILLAARPAMGKTSLGLNVALNLGLSEKLPVLMFSLEMSAVQIGLRLLCSFSRVPLRNIFKGQVTDGEYQILADAAGVLSEVPFFVDDSGGTTISSIRAKARRLKAEKGGLGLIVLDYIQLIAAAGRFESREREISALSRSLKMLAKEMDVPVLAISQLNRQLESRPDKRPRPSDLRESGSLEQDADLILFLYRDSVYNPDAEEPNKTELIIGKQRSGPTKTLELTFLDTITRFEDYSDRQPF